jgi:hypothetical protein
MRKMIFVFLTLLAAFGAIAGSTPRAEAAGTCYARCECGRPTCRFCPPGTFCVVPLGLQCPQIAC